MGDGHVCRWDLPADEPFADVFDADEDTNGAPIHGKILDGIYVLPREGLVCGEGWEEECEPGAGEERMNIQKLQVESSGRRRVYLTRWKIKEVIIILSSSWVGFRSKVVCSFRGRSWMRRGDTSPATSEGHVYG